MCSQGRQALDALGHSKGSLRTQDIWHLGALELEALGHSKRTWTLRHLGILEGHLGTQAFEALGNFI